MSKMSFIHLFGIQKRMQRIIVLILILLDITLPGMQKAEAQQKLEYPEVENTSFRLYNQKNWDSLILYSKAALAAKQDYYYLRLRYGIALFENQNYPIACEQFEKAKAFNSSDPVLLEYLYYSYLYSSRTEDAKLLTSDFSMELLAKMKIHKRKLLESIYLEIGNTISDNISMNEYLNMIQPANIYAESLIVGGNNYYHAGFTIRPLSWISIYQGIGYINQETEQKISHRDYSTEIPGDTIIIKWFLNNMKQTEYYANATISLSNGWTITPAFHYINVSLKINQFNNKDTSLYWATPTDTLQSIRIHYHYPSSTKTIDDAVFFLGISKKINRVIVGLSGSFSNFSNKNQQIVNGSISWYPKGNLDIYTYSNLSYFTEDQSPGRFVFTQMAGGRIWKKIWLEGNLSIGELTHFVEKSAFVAFNTNDEIKSRYGATLILPIGKHIELSLYYLNYTKSGSYITYINNNSFNNKTYTYHNRSIIGGLKWNM